MERICGELWTRKWELWNCSTYDYFLRSFQNGTHYFHFHYFFIGKGWVFSFCMKFHVKQSFPSHLLINFRTEEENNSRWLQFSFTKNPQSKSTWSCFWLKGLCYRDRRSEKEKKNKRCTRHSRCAVIVFNSAEKRNPKVCEEAPIAARTSRTLGHVTFDTRRIINSSPHRCASLTLRKHTSRLHSRQYAIDFFFLYDASSLLRSLLTGTQKPL